MKNLSRLLCVLVCLTFSGCILNNDVAEERDRYKYALLSIVEESAWLNIVDEELLHFRYCTWCSVVQDFPLDDQEYQHEENCPVLVAKMALGK